MADPPPQQFELVHDILISKDDLVYVADRANNRVQVFRPDGTFVKEAFVARNNLGPVGTAHGLAVSADRRQQFLYVLGGDQKLRILNRDTLQVIGQFGRVGHFPGQFFEAAAIAVDSKGDLYVSQGGHTGRMIQKFLLKGFSPVPTD
jgi:DNA-binding beta-propeller fold protein YncE